MDKYFKDFYDSTASIKKRGNRFILTVRDTYGELYYKKTYDSYRGARIALGRIGEGWVEK